jgi:hypothetical protein
MALGSGESTFAASRSNLSGLPARNNQRTIDRLHYRRDRQVVLEQRRHRALRGAHALRCPASYLHIHDGGAVVTLSDEKPLAALGTSNRRIREDVRLGSAAQLLENTSMPAYEIAEIVGYSDATACSRAFNRWSGMTLSTWRKARRGGEVKLRRVPKNRSDAFELLTSLPDDFMAEGRGDEMPQPRDSK